MPNFYSLSNQKQTCEQMYPLIELWLHTDRSQRSICEEYQIKPHTFSYWRSKYQKEKDREPKAPSAFIPIEVNEEGPQAGSYYLEIEYKDGTILRFGRPVDYQVLKNLLPI